MTLSPASEFSPHEAPTRCLHCGSPLLRPEDLFCCRGCQFVHESIAGHGLQSYYKILSGSGSELKPASVAPNKFDYADTPEFIASFTTALPSGQRTMIAFLDGVHCAACVWILERIPELLSGVICAELRMARAELTVSYDPATTSPAKILELINSLGYKPTPVREAAGELARVKANRNFLIKIGVSAVCSMNIMMLAVSLYQGDATGMEFQYRNLFSWASLFLSLPVIFFSAVPLYRTALGGLRSGVLHIDLPLSLAIIAGFLLSCANTIVGSESIYYDSVTALVTLLLIGRWVQHRTLERAIDPYALLYSVIPRFGFRDGKEIFVDAIKVGDTLSASTGQTLVADGVIASGAAQISSAFLTGESKPKHLVSGDLVFAGSKVLTGTIEMRVTEIGSKTRVGRIMQTVESAAKSKSPMVLFLDRCSRRFTAVVLVLAIFTFVFWMKRDLAAAFENSLALLVVSCPCVLAFATPLTFSLAVARAAKKGILFRSAEAIERAAVLGSVVFDKTGTLTRGEPALCSAVVVDRASASTQLLSASDLEIKYSKLCAAIIELERGIEHPIATALRNAWHGVATTSESSVSQISMIPGQGLRGFYLGQPLVIGTSRLVLPDLDISHQKLIESAVTRVSSQGASPIVVAWGKEFSAVLELRDPLRDEAKAVVSQLQKLSLSTHILSGDNNAVVKSVAQELGIASLNAVGEQSPEQKMESIKRLEMKSHTAMVGDGVNDAAAWKAASVGIGLHGGAEISLQVTDAYLTELNLHLVSELIRGSRHTLATIRRNLCISSVYNAIGGTAAICGYISPLAAAVLMPLSSMTVILSALFSRNFR